MFVEMLGFDGETRERALGFDGESGESDGEPGESDGDAGKHVRV